MDKKIPKRPARAPIEHWSYSSLMSFLRNPLAWYKRYVEKIYDTPSSPSSFVGRAGHLALEHFYKGVEEEEAIKRGNAYLRTIADFEINFGSAKSTTAQRKKRLQMEKQYEQAISFYLARPPRHRVVGVEVNATAHVEGLLLPVKAISDLVVDSRAKEGALDIVDHKFVDVFSAKGAPKLLFVIQALFNYYTVRDHFGKPVKRFIVQECKRKKNTDGSSQMRRHVINFDECDEEFLIFRKLISDATREISRPRVYLPNPSDMFEGENSFDIYRLGLIEDAGN